MTHEIICLSNPYLALSSCGDVRNVFLLSHHETLHNGVTVRPSYQKWYRMETSSCWSPDRACTLLGSMWASAGVPVAQRPLCSKKNCTISHKTEVPQSLVSGFQNIHHHLQKYSKTPPGYGVVLEFLIVSLAFPDASSPNACLHTQTFHTAQNPYQSHLLARLVFKEGFIFFRKV